MTPTRYQMTPFHVVLTTRVSSCLVGTVALAHLLFLTHEKANQLLVSLLEAVAGEANDVDCCYEYKDSTEPLDEHVGVLMRAVQV